MWMKFQYEKLLHTREHDPTRENTVEPEKQRVCERVDDMQRGCEAKNLMNQQGSIMCPYRRRMSAKNVALTTCSGVIFEREMNHN